MGELSTIWWCETCKRAKPLFDHDIRPEEVFPPG